MKRLRPYIFIAIITIVVFGVFANVVQAQTTSGAQGSAAVNTPLGGTVTGAAVGNSNAAATSSWMTDLGNAISDVFLGGIVRYVTGAMAIVAWVILSVCGWLLSASGVLLNVSMYLTTHLASFINNTPVIYTVWGIIRDLSSTLLIFFILYAAIQMILGLQDAKYGELIKNIIIVGVLINFSFFFTRTLIDLSNIVSLEFYSAMAPTNTAAETSTKTADTDGLVKSMLTSGGISNIIMGAISIDNFWKNSATSGKALFIYNDNQANINIVILEVGAIVVVVFTIIDFLVISLICIARVAILLFLLGFSPIWIAAKAIPQLEEISGQWMKQFKAQLLFLPAYLAFLYVALKIVTASNLSNVIAAQGMGTTPDVLWGNMINLVVGFSIIIFLLNIPIIAAAKVAGVSGGFISKAYSSMTKKVGSWTKSGASGAGAWAGRNTVGAAASRLNQSSAMRNFYANNPNAGLLVSKRLSSIGSAGFGGKKGGYEGALKSKVKDIEALNKHIGTVDESLYSNQEDIDNAKDNAKLAQARFATKLPNRSILNIFKDRANKQAQVKINKAKKKEDAIKNLKTYKDRNKTIDNEIDALEAKIKSDDTAVGFARPKGADHKDIARLEALKNEKVELEKSINDAQKDKDEAGLETLVKLLDKKGESGEEKPKDKPKP